MGFMLIIVYLLWSVIFGPKATANPFGAKGLEWTLPRLPDPHNFHEIPVVTEEAYAYGEDPHGDSDATEEESKQEEHVV